MVVVIKKVVIYAGFAKLSHRGQKHYWAHRVVRLINFSFMWYFILKQDELKPEPYRTLQTKATLTEVEPFNEPYDNLCLFTVTDYASFVDTLDVLGLRYDVLRQRPTREQLLEHLRER